MVVVGFACELARVLRALSMVRSTARAQHRKLPMICSSRFLSLSESVGDVSGGVVFWDCLPWLIGGAG